MNHLKLIDDFLQAWKHDWKNNRLLFWLELGGTSCSIIASLLIGILAANPPLLLVFTFWLSGSILFVISFSIRKNSSALVLMLFYTIMNTVGLINLLA